MTIFLWNRASEDAEVRATAQALDAARGEQIALPLRESLERIRGVLDSALDGILTIDGTGIVLTANAAAERMFGFLPGELAGKRLTDLLSEECREESSPGLGRRFRVGYSDIVGRVVEITGLRKDSSPFPIDLSIWEVRFLGKRVFTGIVRDIRERKVAQDALQEAEVRNVLTDLVFNALDAMARGGTLTIACARRAAEAIVEVRDTGVGRSEEIRRRCLEPFYTTKGACGTGLGLSVAHGIMERHGGRIESEEGKGTVVRLRFPIEAGRASSPAEHPKGPSARPVRVLVTEDDEMIREMLSGYLTVAGHEVVLARNGKEATDRLRSEELGPVVTDMAMREMNGAQLAAARRRSGSKVPVLHLSGLAQQMKPEGTDLEGVDLVLEKPVSLAEAVATLTSRR